jgi:hypothetical protein
MDEHIEQVGRPFFLNTGGFDGRQARTRRQIDELKKKVANRTGDPAPPRIRKGKRFIFMSFLLRIRGGAGSPVMAVALVE